MKYLRVYLAQRVNFGIHASSVAKKANNAIRTLMGIMPNTGGQGTVLRNYSQPSPIRYFCKAPLSSFAGCLPEIEKY